MVFSNAYDENYAAYFLADDAVNAHVAYNSDKKLQLAAGAQARKYTVTVTAENGGTAQAAPASAAAGETVTLTATPNDGYHFKAWEVLSGNVAITDNGFAMPAENVSIKAIFEKHSFTAETAEEEYLKSAATCTEKAVYYKSCAVCNLTSKGTADEATFASGNVLGHNFGVWTSNSDGTHTRVCSRNEIHTETNVCAYGDWKTNRYSHWRTCTLCGAETEPLNHSDQDDDHCCDVCGMQMTGHAFTAEKAEAKYLKSAATCMEKAVYYKSCTLCGLTSKGTAGEETFESGNVLGHDFGAWTSNGDGTHTRTCSRDKNHTETKDCHGGTATCTEKAVCADCKTAYGELTAHNFTAEKAEAEYLKSAATCMEKAVYYKSCTLCGLTSKGTAGEEAFESGNVLGHDFGAWTSNGDGTHTRTCSRNKSHTETKDCHGGTANCHAKAICEICKQAYGAVDPAKHDGGTELKNAKDATCTATGYTGDTYCKGCGVKLSDGAVIPMLEHSYGEWTIVREPTAGAQGERTRTCLNCSHQQTEVLHATGKFEDVPAGSYYEEAVIWAAEEGITSGTDTTHFSPDSICTRAQAVTFLWRAAGSPAPETSTMPFTDVSVGSYYYDAVLWAAENGITAGTSKTTFSPNADCTRAHIVSFLWRSEKYPAAEGSNPFTDVAPTAYYATAVQWAVANRITAGTSETTFSPNAGCTRAQIVTFLWRWMK